MGTNDARMIDEKGIIYLGNENVDIFRAQNELKRDWSRSGLGIKYPLYSECYQEALKTILNNIESIDIRTGNMGNKQYMQAKRKESNIIAFIGRRGSGKTTAVSEFGEILSGFSDKRDWIMNELMRVGGSKMDLCNNRMINFHVLPTIDASVLGDEEDLLVLIWANMFETFQKCMGQNNRNNLDDVKKRLIKEFDDVYKNYNQIRQGQKEQGLGDTVLAKLKNISSSDKIRQSFQNLLDDYLRILFKDVHEETYMVVIIDDLDMNLKKGYEMLEQLHKYLANPRVIVLTAIDYKQMSIICEKRFKKDLGYKEDIDRDETIEYVKELCKDYLLKVIPLLNRIYLPGKNIIEKQARVAETVEDLPGKFLKEFILVKISKKMGIFLDNQGIKKHFYLPETIRELVNFNDFLNSLFEVDWNSVDGNPMHVYDLNHERFNTDILERMALELLDTEQQRWMKLILYRNIERRGQYAVNFIQERLNRKKEEKEGLKDGVDEQSYRYGNLLNGIYNLGRERYHDKTLVYCILASFSSEMVREYYSYKYNLNNEARDRAMIRLSNFRGKSFSGTLMENALTNVIADYKVVAIKNTELSQMSNIRFRVKFSLDRTEKSFSGKELINIISDIVPKLECILMFCSDFRNTELEPMLPEWIFSLRPDSKESSNNIELDIICTAERAYFDAFDFLGKELECIACKDAMIQNMIGRVWDFMVEFQKSFNNFIESNQELHLYLDKIVKEKSLYTHIGDDLSFPYYDLDLAYNVMKRVKRNIIDKIPRTIKMEDIYTYLKRVYGLIGEELKKEDSYYEKNGNNSPHYFEKYRDSCFIQAFGMECERKELNVKGFGETGLLPFREMLFNFVKPLWLPMDDEMLPLV